MRPFQFSLLAFPMLLAACSAVPGRASRAPAAEPYASRVSGILGVTEITSLGLDVDSSIGNTIDDDEFTLPMIGAQFQTPFRSERLEWGWEAGFSVSWENESEAVVIDTGTVVVFAENELLLADISFGLYAAKDLGERWRIYGAAGPLFQFGRVDLDLDQTIGGDGSITEDGVGVGYYTRVGFDFQIQQNMSVGLMARWIDSSLDLGGQLDDLEIEAVQIGVVFTSTY